MRIIHYLPAITGPEAGSVNAGRGWCQALAERGARVVALGDLSATERRPPPGTETIMLQHTFAGPMRVPRRAEEAVEGSDVAVLHGGWTLGNIVVGRACARLDVPFIVTAHGAYACEVWGRKRLLKTAWATLLERRHLARAAAVHVFFPEDRSSISRCMRAMSPTVVAPNGITPPPGVTWDGGSGAYLLWLGRFDPETKGLDLLIRAMARIPPAQRPELRLHGRDWRNGKSLVQRMIDEGGVRSSVRLGEFIEGDEKWETMRRAAGFVYPSRWDACPVAVSEAAAVGVPTMVGRYALGNFLMARDAAIQVDPDPTSIAHGLEALLSDRGRQVAAKGAAVARRELSWEAVSRNWLEQVARLIGRTG